jgi:hypothetical protein
VRMSSFSKKRYNYSSITKILNCRLLTKAKL